MPLPHSNKIRQALKDLAEEGLKPTGFLLDPLAKRDLEAEAISLVDVLTVKAMQQNPDVVRLTIAGIPATVVAKELW